MPSGSPPQLPSPPTSSTRPVPPRHRAPFEIRELILRRQESLRGGRRRRRVGDAFFILVSGAVVVRKGDLVLATLKAEATTKLTKEFDHSPKDEEIDSSKTKWYAVGVSCGIVSQVEGELGEVGEGEHLRKVLELQPMRVLGHEGGDDLLQRVVGVVPGLGVESGSGLVGLGSGFGRRSSAEGSSNGRRRISHRTRCGRCR